MCVETVLQSASPLHRATGRWARRKSIAETRLRKQEERIYWTTRHRSAERTKARGDFELQGVFSRRLGDQRWRTELDFSSRELLDDLHRYTKFRAGPKI